MIFIKKTIQIEGMTCPHCEGHVKKELESVCGVTTAQVSASNKKAVVELAHDVDADQLRSAVEKAGYTTISVE